MGRGTRGENPEESPLVENPDGEKTLWGVNPLSRYPGEKPRGETPGRTPGEKPR